MIARININIADVYRDVSPNSERISQGLFNEAVEILEVAEKLTRIRFPDGYEGWIRNQFISKANNYSSDHIFIIDAATAPAFERPEVYSRRMTFLPYGSLLYGEMTGDYMEVSSERYGALFIHGSDLIFKGELTFSASPSKEHIIYEAEKFLGTPYLWGGRSFFGMDCSGFVKAIMQRFGIELPRDTKDQINVGRDVTREKIQPGDLLFFPRHVALATSSDMYIHCSSSNGGVAYNSLDPQNPMYDKSLSESFINAKRVLT